MLLSEIASVLSYSAIGDLDFEIIGIAYAEDAKENEIAIIKKREDLVLTKAKVVLTEPTFGPVDKSYLYCSESVNIASIKVAIVMIDNGLYPNYHECIDYSLTPSFFRLGADCKIDSSAHIEAFTSIGNRVRIGKNTYIGSNVTIGSDVVIGDNVIIKDGCRIGADAFVHFCKYDIGYFAGIGTTILQNNVEVGYNSMIQRGTFTNTVVGEGTIIGDLVGIGHDCTIGKSCLLMGQGGLAGNCVLEDNVTMYGQSGARGNLKIGHNAVIMGQTGIWKDVEPETVISGNFGRKHKDELVMQAKLRRLLRR